MKQQLIFILFIATCFCFGQSVEIGQWQEYLNYSNGISVEMMNDKVYTTTTSAIFVLDPENNNVKRLSKINALNDVDVVASKKHPSENLLVVAYANSNIDLIGPENTHNISDLVRANIIGSKKINNIHFNEDIAYLTCDFGIVALNVIKKEIANTFYLNKNKTLPSYDLCFNNDSVFAATDSGVYASSVNLNLSDYNSWNKQSANQKIDHIIAHKNNVLYSVGDSIYTLHSEDTPTAVKDIKNMIVRDDRSIIISRRRIHEIIDNNVIELTTSTLIYEATDVIFDGDILWISDEENGLVRALGPSKRVTKPTGPNSNLAYSIHSTKERLFVSPGGINSTWNNNKTNQGIYWSDNVDWKHIPYSELNYVKDITSILEKSDGKLFLSTWNDGIFELNYNSEEGQYELAFAYDAFSTNGAITPISNDPTAINYGWVRIKNLVLDNQEGIWATNSLSNKPLIYKPNGQDWMSFDVSSYNTLSSHVGDLIIDDYGQKWFYIAKGGGLIVYNDNETPQIASDDQDKHLSTSIGNGNLPSGFVISLAKDKDGEIWVGTDKGVAVFYNPENMFSSNNFDAQQVLVEVEDGYVEPILSSENITAIAVDGANRKWFGTQSSGLYLYSDDGSEQIFHFTEDNSPLLSNTITDIEINQNTGGVYVATDKGLVSYRSGAIEGAEQHGNVLVYPNPVRENYDGPIAIKNLVSDAQVKITDINGVLVKDIIALGGQAVWDGKNINGERVSTGVYLVFSTNPLGTETNVAKILFIN